MAIVLPRSFDLLGCSEVEDHSERISASLGDVSASSSVPSPIGLKKVWNFHGFQLKKIQSDITRWDIVINCSYPNWNRDYTFSLWHGIKYSTSSCVFWHSGLYSKEGLRRIEWHGVPIITCRNCFWFWTCMSIKLVEKTRDLKRQICQLSTEQVDAWTFGQHCRHDGTFVLHLFVNFLQYNCYKINKSILWYQFIIFF